jgi:hypothetical protein
MENKMKEYQHVQYLDLFGNGVLKEVVVIKEEVNGDKYFIQTDLLDLVDLQRLREILDKRDSEKYPLWDLMGATMLRNGMNALEYFHQLVRVKTLNGPIVQPGRAGSGIVQVRVPQAPESKRARAKAE